MAFFEQWGIYGRGFDLANADNEGEIADLTHLVYAFGGVEPQDGAEPDLAGALATPLQPVQENPNLPNYNPVVCSSLDVWADYQTPGLTVITGANGQAEPNTGADGLAGNFQQLAELKAKYPNLKVVMSLGGYNGSAFFSQAASTPAARQLSYRRASTCSSKVTLAWSEGTTRTRPSRPRARARRHFSRMAPRPASSMVSTSTGSTRVTTTAPLVTSTALRTLRTWCS